LQTLANTKSKEPTDIKGLVEVTTEASLIRKLRGIVEPEGKRGSWMRFMSDKQLLEVYHRLKLNHGIGHIVRIVQKEWKICPESAPQNLRKAVKKFRDKTVGLIRAYERSSTTTERKEFAAKEEKRATEIMKKIDGMEELAWLIQVQKWRIKQIVRIEKENKEFAKLADQAIAQQRENINAWMTHAEVLGLIDRKPNKWNFELKAQFDGILDTVVRDDGNKLIQAANRFLEMAKEKAITMKKVSEGEYEYDAENSKEG